MATPTVIDMKAYQGGVRVLSGRDRGSEARQHAGLASLDAQPEAEVIVRIPDDLVFIASSFFLGMFGDSIRRFGETEFRRRYQFQGPYSEHVLRDVIREALKRGSPLGPAMQVA